MIEDKTDNTKWENISNDNIRNKLLEFKNEHESLKTKIIIQLNLLTKAISSTQLKTLLVSSSILNGILMEKFMNSGHLKIRLLSLNMMEII